MDRVGGPIRDNDVLLDFNQNFEDVEFRTIWKPHLYKLQKEAPRPIKISSPEEISTRPFYLGSEFHGILGHSQAESRLQQEGAYLIRISPGSSVDTISLSFRVVGKVHHYRLYFDGQYFVNEKKKFDFLEEMVGDGLLTKYMDTHAGKYIKNMTIGSNYHTAPLTKFSSIKKSRLISPKSHNFALQTFRGLYWCDWCGNFLWGFTKQGVKCKDCGLNTHQKCSKNVVDGCSKEWPRGVFGIDLSNLATQANAYRSFVVDKCIEEIERRGLDAEGIYRVSGFADEIDSLKLAFNKDLEKTDLSVYENIHVIAGVLKAYLRLLPQPLIVYEVHHLLLSSLPQAIDGDLSGIRIALQKLPTAHYETLRCLTQHLSRVIAHTDKTRMTSNSMATIFSPTIMPIQELEKMKDMPIISSYIQIVQIIIQNHDYIF